MRPFEYASPASVAQVIGLLPRQWSQAAILAGGTDLLALMKDDVVTPRRLINIKDLKELRGITSDPRQGLRIGALTTLHDLSEHVDVRKTYPALAEAAADAASPQIRNMATLGGNLAQRPRCWYFRNGMGLMPKTPDGKSLVLEGDNRYHAILGNDGPAYFVSPSSVAPILLALRARVRLQGPKGTRELPIEQFFRIPRTENEREHALEPSELITHVLIPPTDTRQAHYEVRQKEAFDWPLATASVALRLAGGKVEGARVVLGHVAPIPWLSPEAGAALNGKALNEQSAEAAAQAALAKAKPLRDNPYKVQLARVAVKRAILKAGGAA